MNPIILFMIFTIVSNPMTSTKSDYSVATIEFDSLQYYTKKMIQCFDVEELCKYRPQNDKKIVTITVTDPDANLFNESIDQVDISVWSDTDPKGITITAHETHVNSGVFVEKILIVDDASGIARVQVSDGDSLLAKYIDKTIPVAQDAISLEVTVSSLIGLLGYPPERVPVYNPHVLDNRGEKISSSKAEDQIQIVATLQNMSFHEQPFAYLVQIKNHDGIAVSLSWINGTMSSKQSLQPSLSWIPHEPGTYLITIFVWESIINPTALSPSVEFEIPIEDIKEFEEIMKENEINLKSEPSVKSEDELFTVTESFKKKYDAVIEGTILWCMGHKTYPVRYQCDIQVEQYIKFNDEKTPQLTILGYRETVADWGQKTLFGLDYPEDENYYEIMERVLLDDER
jgi:hypothetical protein